MSRKPKLVRIKREPVSVFDRDVCAPDYFSVDCNTSEWVRRCEAFIDTMYSLDRVVILQVDRDTNKLFLSSIAEKSDAR